MTFHVSIWFHSPAWLRIISPLAIKRDDTGSKEAELFSLEEVIELVKNFPYDHIDHFTVDVISDKEILT